MQLKTVDLLMMKGMRAYENVGAEEFSACKSETGVRRERTIFVEPGTNGALRDLAMIPPAHESLCLGEGVTEVES